MNVAWYSLLAQEAPRLKVPWVLIVIALVVLYVITRLVKKAKALAEREQARQQEEQRDRRSASAEHRRRRQEASAREAMSALREILGVEPEVDQRPPPPQAAPAPVIRPVADRQRQPAPEPAAGQGVRRGVGRLRDDLAAKEIERRRRLRKPELLRTTIAPATGPEVGPQVRVRVNLGDRGEAVKAILYSEILGPPKALRRGPESWER
jgi:hypothetical protein